MDKEIRWRQKNFILLFMCMLLSIAFLFGCGDKNVAEEATAMSLSEDAEAAEEERKRQEELQKLTNGDIEIKTKELTGYATDATLTYQEDNEQLMYSCKMEQIPKSDDAYIYLFSKETFENEYKLFGEPVASALKGTDCEITFEYENEFLFARFVPSLLINGKYVPLCGGVYLSNPEALAENTQAYPQTESKKGLLLDPTIVGTEKTIDLGVKHAIYNIPLSIIMGETTDEEVPTIVYNYKGKDYLFNGAALRGYDGLFSYLNDMGMSCTAIILNDWNDDHIEMIHPKARKKSNESYYYMFNATEQGGTRELEAIASFLTERYSGGEYGLVHSWVIANEINQQNIWNYMNTEDVEYYAQEFEKAFRIFYQAAKSQYANSQVYFSIDHDWNSNGGKNSKFFNGKDLIVAFNDMAEKHGNYDWGIAIHPYPNPISEVEYWKQEYDKTQDAEVLTIMNLNVLTDFLKQDEYLNADGKVRNITITELGFTSREGEKLQAAAFAYCYYILEANPYIKAFIMNRQTDAPEEMEQGLAFGIYNCDKSEKYIKDVFKYIDTDEAEEYTEFMLDILEVETLEEALEWAE